MSEAAITEQDVLQALTVVPEPGGGGDLVSRGLVRDVKICDGNVAFTLVSRTPDAGQWKGLEALARQVVMGVPGVTLVNVRRQLEIPGRAPGAQDLIPGVKNVIAVGSGKGGVGKSTVAVNLSVALAQDGARVGLLDADVYGPSIPVMMGIRQQPEVEDGRMIPMERHGVKLMSLGFLMPDEASHVIWRGPMVGGAVKQMLAESAWGKLDYLVIDLPPGTGDAQLTLAQSVPITGAVVVMTSQDVAVGIASKAVGMFRKLNVPILGVVGNMDTFACPHCGEETPIFSRGGSEAAARQLGVQFLGSVPLDPATVEHGDAGTPTVVAAPESAQAEAFRKIAGNVAAGAAALQLAASGQTAGLSGLLSRFKSG